MNATTNESPRFQKIIEHVYGTHAYLKIICDWQEEEIDVYWNRDGSMTFKTTGDEEPERRERIIDAFWKLF